MKGGRMMDNSTMIANLSEPNLETSGPPSILYYIMGFWALGTGTTGFLANILVILVFCITPKLRTPFNYLLMNLSACELVISVTGNWLLAANSFSRRWLLSARACQVNAFGMTYLGILSIVTLTVLAIQRYMMITQDRQFPLSTNLSTCMTLVLIWVYTLAIALPPFLGFGEFGLNTLKVSCGVVWDFNINADHYKVEYMVYIYLLGFLIPLMIIFYCYTKIMKAVKSSGMNGLLENDAKRRAKRRRDRKITNMVAIMLAAYLITWFPYAIVSISEAAGYKPYSSLTFAIYALPTMLAKVCVCLDPLIYFGFNPQFQDEVRKYWNKQVINLEVSFQGSKETPRAPSTLVSPATEFIEATSVV
ncbi:rhodopsin [Eurytemora carolleeae]|uniref:rhodopsin n=1 Tax=Eurytemora carolleeae TaxID=1294199 RepID=UPI000C765ABC|nr:rhodopsin [Eurytemora carolleeae]|eukprot:XP_023335087.1 rhodopsin-like [Eurytemora affinis]